MIIVLQVTEDLNKDLERIGAIIDKYPSLRYQTIFNSGERMSVCEIHIKGDTSQISVREFNTYPRVITVTRVTSKYTKISCKEREPGFTRKRDNN